MFIPRIVLLLLLLIFISVDGGRVLTGAFCNDSASIAAATSEGSISVYK